MVTADSACDPTQDVTAASTALNAGAVAVVGHTCGGTISRDQGIYNAAGVPIVAPSAGTPLLTEQGYTTTFRAIAGGDAEAVLMATHFRQSLGLDAVAIVDWGPCEWSKDAFSNTFTSLGGTITSRHTVASTDAPRPR